MVPVMYPINGLGEHHNRRLEADLKVSVASAHNLHLSGVAYQFSTRMLRLVGCGTRVSDDESFRNLSTPDRQAKLADDGYRLGSGFRYAPSRQQRRFALLRVLSGR